MNYSGLGCSCCTGRRGFLRAALAACVTTGLARWATPARASETVRIGMPTSDHYSPAFVAKANGFFEKAGLQMEFKTFPTGGPVIEGLTSRSLDIGLLGTPGIISVARNFAMTSTMGIALEGSGLLVRDGGAKKIADLAGARVGLPARGSIAHLLLLRALTRSNIDQSSVKIVEIRDVQAMSIGLQRGEIDAVAIWEPWVYQLEQVKGIRKLALSHDIWPNHQCDFMWVGTAFLKERPDVVKRVMDGLLEGMRSLGRDLPASVNTVSAALHVPANVESHAMRRQQFTHVLQRENIQDQYRLLANLNIVKDKEIPSWDRLVDPAMYEYANKRWAMLEKS
ncbi:MAG: ABC transporter substrate-binding protein [Burkholderiales bacterium]